MKNLTMRYCIEERAFLFHKILQDHDYNGLNAMK